MSSAKLILPSAYLPSIGHISAIIAAQKDGLEVVVDHGEHYIKRSTRNRAQIMTAQGVIDLTVPVKKANRPRQPMSTIKIDNTKKWQHQHWIAILSAYKSSPFFDHYAPYIEPIYGREWSSLTELNKALFTVVLKLLGLKIEVRYSAEYLEAMKGDIDLRPKGAAMIEEPKPYIQVFEDRQPFAPNLSILDLLFCEGPNASSYL